MKILVTGGCGFIGSAFMEVMLDNPKIKIINIDKISYCANKNVCKQYKDKNFFFFLSKIAASVLTLSLTSDSILKISIFSDLCSQMK